MASVGATVEGSGEGAAPVRDGCEAALDCCGDGVAAARGWVAVVTGTITGGGAALGLDVGVVVGCGEARTTGASASTGPCARGLGAVVVVPGRR